MGAAGARSLSRVAARRRPRPRARPWPLTGEYGRYNGRAGGSQIERGGHLNSKCREVRLHAIAADGICRKPAGAREPVTGGTGGHGAHAPSGPRREWRRRGRRRTPPLGAALARLRALEPPPWAGRDAAGTPRAASGGVRSRDASLPAGGTGYATGADGPHGAHDGHGAANSPPEAATRETDSRMGGHDSATGARGAHRGTCRPNAGPKGGRLPRPR